MEAGARVEASDVVGGFPTLYAVKKGHTGVVRVLADAGADLNRKTRSGNTLVGIALQHGHRDVVRLCSF